MTYETGECEKVRAICAEPRSANVFEVAKEGFYMKKLRLGATFAAIALACVRPVAAQIGIVSVTGGRVEGVTADGVTSFKGIPFAAPPVGNLRWRDPQPVRPWKGIKPADRFAPGCMQDSRWVPVYGFPPALSEDCLYLNVWTSARSARERRPVMVWIYGGAFSGGTTSQPVYDGARLARKGVVLVSLAYQVGVFGFLSDPQLSREQDGRSGNYGILDMIQGLRWVEANIAKFGGDPSNVTLFGESAGGIAVSMLAASPAARGLFERAICESGSDFAPARSSPFLINPPAGYNHEGGERIGTLANAEQYGASFLAKLGAKSIAAARELPAAEILKAYEGGPSANFAPVFDGRILPGDQYVLYEERRFTDTPVLLGTNSDEGSIFVGPGVTRAKFEEEVRADYSKDADALLAVYPHATDAEAEQAARDLARDTMFAWGTWSWARLQSEYGKNKAYLYYFDEHVPQYLPQGAPHGAEIGYVFDNLGTLIHTGSKVTFPAAATDPALAAMISRYWVNFAKTGNPNGPGLPHWPAFNTSSQRVMYLDAQPHAGPVPNLRQLKVLDAYFAHLLGEAHAHSADGADRQRQRDLTNSVGKSGPG